MAVCVKVSLPLAQGSSDLTHKGQATLVMGVKRPLAQTAARHPKIAQSHKSRNNAPKFQLFSGSLPSSLQLVDAASENGITSRTMKAAFYIGVASIDKPNFQT